MAEVSITVEIQAADAAQAAIIRQYLDEMLNAQVAPVGLASIQQDGLNIVAETHVMHDWMPPTGEQAPQQEPE